MRHSLLILLPVTLALLPACSDRSRSHSLEVAPCDEITKYYDSIEITGLAVEGDNLVVDVQYRGGAAGHAFSCCFSTVWNESSPPLISMTLYHGANEDAGEETISDQVAFDLRPLVEFEQELYGDVGGKYELMLCHLECWEDEWDPFENIVLYEI